MTLKIEINLHPEGGDLREQLETHVAALGFAPKSYEGEGLRVVRTTAVAETSEPATEAEEDPTPSTDREFGKASEGRARRTKAEIAEDEELEKLAADAGVTIENVIKAMAAGHSRAEVTAQLAAKAEASGGSPQISSGEECVGPEDDAETAAQDKADEKAEVEANRDAEKPLTVDDVKQAVGLYVTKFGIPAAQEDGPGLFVSVLGAPPADEPGWKMSILPDDQDKLRKCVAAWEEAAASETRYKAA